MVKRIRLSRPSNTACCITEGGTTQAHTVREHVGSLPQSNWTLRRMVIEVRKGEDSSKPPQERGLLGRSHTAEAVPNKSIPSNTSRRIKAHICKAHGEAVPNKSIPSNTSRRIKAHICKAHGVPSFMYCNFGSERNVV